MFQGTSWGRNLDILHRSMDASMLRQSVIANNIANVDTPGFRRSQVNFESSLKRALEAEQAAPHRFQAARTHEGHREFHQVPDYREVEPRRVLDWQTQAKNNENNVDIEVETMNMLNNMLSYQMMTESVNQQFQRLNIAMA